jgi:DNA invertase Pin-like site-specific DNA recombinase
MSTYVVYVRRSYKEANAADVSDATQEAAARGVLPAGATVDVISDSGGHNSGFTDDRVGYQRLIERVRSGEIVGVAVYDLSRLARNTKLMLTLRDELERHNVGLFIATMPGVGFDGAAGRFMFTTLCAAAQLQRDMDSERAKRLTRTKHEQGGHNGLDPFGYRAARDENGRLRRPHQLEVVPAEAEAVRMIFDRYGTDDVGSMGELARSLREQGHERRGRLWSEKGVQDVLRRAPFYLGTRCIGEARTSDPERTSRSSRRSRRISPSAWRSAAIGRVGMAGRVVSTCSPASRTVRRAAFGCGPRRGSPAVAGGRTTPVRAGATADARNGQSAPTRSIASSSSISRRTRRRPSWSPCSVRNSPDCAIYRPKGSAGNVSDCRRS